MAEIRRRKDPEKAILESIGDVSPGGSVRDQMLAAWPGASNSLISGTSQGLGDRGDGPASLTERLTKAVLAVAAKRRVSGGRA